MKFLLVNGGGWHSWFIPQLSLPYLSVVLQNAGHESVVVDLNLELRHKLLLNPKVIGAAVTNASLSNLRGYTARERQILRELSSEAEEVADAVQRFGTEVQNELGSGRVCRSTGDILSLLQEVISRSIAPCSWNEYYCDPWYSEVLEKGLLPMNPTAFLKQCSKNALTDAIESTMSIVDEYRPDVLGFSVDDYEQIGLILFMASLARIASHPPRLVVVGGYFFSKVLNIDLATQEQLQALAKLYPILDIVAFGDGEVSLSSIAETANLANVSSDLENGLFLKDGVYAKLPKGGNSLCPSVSFDFPRCNQYVGLPLRLTRGCSYGRCAFCRHTRARHLLGGWAAPTYYTTVSHSQIDIVLERAFDESGLRLIEFVDLSLTRGYLKHISRVSRIFGAHWGAQLRLDVSITAELLAQLSDSGAKYLAVGIESFSQTVSDRFQKGCHVNHVRQTIERLHAISETASKILVVNLMWGFPGETWIEFRETLEEAQRLGLRGSLLKFELLPGSPVHLYPDAYGVSQVRTAKRFLDQGPPLRLTWKRGRDDARKQEYLAQLNEQGLVNGYYYDFSGENRLQRRFATPYWYEALDDIEA